MTRAPAGSFRTVVGVFVLFGPLLGGLALVILDILRGGPPDFGWAMIAVIASPIAGILPAAATGLMAAAISSRVDSRLLWALACAALGAGLAGLVLGGGGFMPIGDIAAAGAAAGLGSALLSLPVRPRWR